ncbi:serine/threonine protein kinase [Halomonas sp. MCCC 1A17488]|uniref:Stress response kinase A n=1 Tax=Billgrantia sulfidoxydans TaxID=2733484 RepID=A0ABX7W565_9GAMM|nr:MULTISPECIES: serine/threonine protein kinase [Halomonas]MCE8014663.1 serine/threonine protein kinase [Halomonas sp. MCCC 1A17488]MCG3237996.1 serine/threonine protein kinase [Halomonas sp. MCCC 1A17488]QPP48224.1 serine/threonine protein kinase [Halomonas sp. SS10-MC5]QTP55524.1 serine/threonine protein kinase [Halomonas sulfidoxydans]
MHSTPHPFAALSPARVVSAIESLGFWLPGEPFALNSYENRVFLLYDDEGRRWVAKFYRPGRWSDAQIQEEHDFLDVLAAEGVAVAPPWRDDAGRSLHHVEGFRLALFPQLPGQAPELENPAHLFALGELIGAVHAVGERADFEHRVRLDLDGMVNEARMRVLAAPWLDRRQRHAYAGVAEALHAALQAHAWTPAQAIRVQGDCHIGNLLGRDDTFALVDFDDAMMAPAVQDLWMFLTAEHEAEWHMQLSEVLEGYEQHREFDRRELALIEPLRTLRLMRHSAWLVARWDDPAFPQAFPWVTDGGYWDAHIRQLEQQRLVLGQAPRWLA